MAPSVSPFLVPPEEKVDPTEAEPIEPDPVLSLSGGAAISLLVAGNVGAAMLIGGISFTIVQSLKYVLSSPLSTARRPLGPHEPQSSLCSKTEAQSVASSQEALDSGRMILTPGAPTQGGTPGNRERQKGILELICLSSNPSSVPYLQ